MGLTLNKITAAILGRVGSVIGGVAIGSPGSGVLAGYSLLQGDDFNVLPTRFDGSNLGAAKYGSDTPESGLRRLSTKSARQIMLDPAWRGQHSDSPLAYGLDPLSVSGGLLTITASQVNSSGAYYASLPATYTGGAVGVGDVNSKPFLISGCLDSWPSFLVSAAGSWAYAVRASVPASVARGWWPAWWTTTIANWPDFGEVDLVEQRKDATTGAVTYTSTLHESTSDGSGDQGGGVGVNMVSARSVPANQQVLYLVVKSGTTLTFYDDIVSPGTIAQTGTYTNALVGRLRGGHRLRIELGVSTVWDGATFNIADWPVGITVDYWQCFVPTGVYSAYVSPTVLASVQTTPGGSWAASFPPASSLYGSAPSIEEVNPAFYNEDCPGAETKTGSGATGIAPGGMTIDLTARTTSGTVPTTRGGTTYIMLTGSFSAGGQARQAFLPFQVAPAAQGTLFVSQNVVASGAITPITIAFTDFHSGDIGPHTYSVTNDSVSGWLTAAYGFGNQSVTLSGTSPSSGTVTVTINCTNRIGQVTTVTRTLTVNSAFLFSDNFNRVNQTLQSSSNWTLVAGGTAGLTISGNVVQYNGTDLIGVLYTAPDTSSQRHYVQANIYGGFSGFIAVQATDANNYIGLRRDPTTNVVAVFKRVAGTLTAQCAFAETLADTDTVYMAYDTGALTVKKNGTTLTPTSGSLTVLSGPAASSKCGLVGRVNSSINAFDNFVEGAL